MSGTTDLCVERNGAADFCLDQAYVQNWSHTRIETELDRICASTAYSVCAQTGKVKFCGSRGEHLQIDPDLDEICVTLGLQKKTQFARFYNINKLCVLCLEDGLSGWFLNETLNSGPKDDWVILHLDDHLDMMPTLLMVDREKNLRDPETRTQFFGNRQQDWYTALTVGTITIGSYLTAVVHGLFQDQLLHIRHLSSGNAPITINHLYGIAAQAKQYPIFGAQRFACTEFCEPLNATEGTLKQSVSVADGISDLPEGRLIMHIDLDFFVNDLNGTSGAISFAMDAQARKAVLLRLDEVFNGLSLLGRTVERWIVATSPGFCGVRHWQWLLEALNTRIWQLNPKAGYLSFG